MNNRIKKFVEAYFEEVPYSEEASKAQSDITAALEAEYEKRIGEHDKDEAFEETVKAYGKLSEMAVLAGYSAEDAERWRSCDETKNLPALKKELRRQRYKIYGAAALCAAVLAELVWFVYDIIALSPIAILVFLLSTAFAGGAILLLRSLYKKEKQYLTEKYDNESFVYLRTLSDRYTKRRFNGIAIAGACIGTFVLSAILILGISKPAEFMENFFANIVLLEIPCYLCTKNRLCFDLMYRRIRLPQKEKTNRQLLAVSVFSAGYWGITVLVVALCSRAVSYPGNILALFGAVFAVLILVYNLVWRKRLTFRNIVVNKRRIAVITAAVLLISGYTFLQRDTWYTQPYINSVAVVPHDEHRISYNEDTGVYTITSNKDDFKILHLTDIHLGGSLFSYAKDIKALKAVYAEIKHTQPDFVIVTGDLCFPMGIMSMSFNNSAPVNQFAAFMRNVDIPWAFTYGNHDTESIATTSVADLNEVYKALSYKTSGNLLYPYVQPNVTGRSNQLIELRNADGSLNNALFLIDSNAYTGKKVNDYDYIHDDQVDWYAGEVQRLSSEEGHTVSSMAFFHIPLQEYRTAYNLYAAGSDEVTYYFGENGEKMMDKVCCSKYPSKFFDRIVELGSTKALFCGHDHYNNMSLEYKGVRLTYGMSIDYLAMPGIENSTAQRGAELITVHADSTFDITQIPLTSIA